MFSDIRNSFIYSMVVFSHLFLFYFFVSWFLFFFAVLNPLLLLSKTIYIFVLREYRKIFTSIMKFGRKYFWLLYNPDSSLHLKVDYVSSKWNFFNVNCLIKKIVIFRAVYWFVFISNFITCLFKKEHQFHE